MSTQHLEVLETTVQKTHQWIEWLAQSAHMDTHTAYLTLRAVLQTLRDRLPAQEAAHFAAQLPLLVRGIFYEGYRPSELPSGLNREQFLEKIAERMTCSRNMNPQESARQVFALLDRFLGNGELEKIGTALPSSLLELFPERTGPNL